MVLAHECGIADMNNLQRLCYIYNYLAMKGAIKSLQQSYNVISNLSVGVGNRKNLTIICLGVVPLIAFNVALRQLFRKTKEQDF